MTAYYNENDSYCVDWLRNLIARGLIADGEVDDRSIRDVQPADLIGFDQCHFFAGIGGWSYALRLAGWPDDAAVWTGSCPCQPFSAAGKRKGTADDRHLWPEFLRLIAACRPAVVFGEQVASAEVVGKQGKGRGVPAQVPLEEPSERFDASREGASAQEGCAVRPRPASLGTSSAYRRRLLRDFWPTVQPRWWENVGQSFLRPGQSERGVRVLEHPSRAPCREQRLGGLGRSEDARDRAFDPGAAACVLERALGKARAEIDGAALSIWLAGVRSDLEPFGYALGASVLPSAGVGAPHIRQRLHWVAERLGDSDRQGRSVERERDGGTQRGQDSEHRVDADGSCSDGSGLGDAGDAGLEGRDIRAVGIEREAAERAGAQRVAGMGDASGDGSGRDGGTVLGAQGESAGERRVVGRVVDLPVAASVSRGVADSDGGLARDGHLQPGRQHGQQPQDGGAVDRMADADEGERGRLADREGRELGGSAAGRIEGDGVAQSGGSRVPWDDFDLVLCRDKGGAYRRVEPGAFPLAHGIPGRVGRLRAYGNAINPWVAKEFIEAYRETSRCDG